MRAGEVLAERAERHQRQGELVVQHHQHAEFRRFGTGEVELLPPEHGQQVLRLLSEQALRGGLAGGVVVRGRGGQSLDPPEPQVMLEGIGGGSVVARPGGRLACGVGGEVDPLGGRAQFRLPLGEEVLVAIAIPAGFDGVGRIGVAAEVVALGEFRQRIVIRGRCIAEVVVQGAEPAVWIIGRRGPLPRGGVP